jgi:hypothetical protein
MHARMQEPGNRYRTDAGRVTVQFRWFRLSRGDPNRVPGDTREQGIAKMKVCRWLKPVLVGQFEFVEWAPANPPTLPLSNLGATEAWRRLSIFLGVD